MWHKKRNLDLNLLSFFPFHVQNLHVISKHLLCSRRKPLGPDLDRNRGKWAEETDISVLQTSEWRGAAWAPEVSKWAQTRCRFLVPEDFQLSAISLPQAWPGSQKRKYTNFRLPHGSAIQLVKNFKMIWVCSLPLARMSNMPTVHMWLPHFARPYVVSVRVCKLAVIQGNGSLAILLEERGSIFQDSLACRRPGGSRSSRPSERKDSNTDFKQPPTLLPARHHTFQDMMETKKTSRKGCLPWSSVNSRDLHSWAAQWQ